MKSLRVWIVLSWILLPAVMFGGTLLLRRVSLGDPTAFQATWVRAFHAHGGVLMMMAILYYMFLDRTALSDSVKRWTSLALFAGIGGLAGGFLLHAIVGQPHQLSIGTLMAYGGAALIASALVVLIYGLITTPAAPHS